MEFEIKDDPQGVPDLPDGDRDGGLEEDLAVLRKSARQEEMDMKETAPS
ncbi:hypothetical protein GRI58_06465 [Porphyrobacter algicida]|uniref:Uncharacterized protein n=1 Tax=Qipengyuania algicida TaxID=1836209 RepID=A0A845AI15_9SPHN|nr:hypothetical protein [Qipengyuania algicida]MXP28465.1 hypothetical protein [Qipengyuania algicida]